MCKIGLAREALYYYTLLYWGKVVVNTTVGQLKAVRRLSSNFRGGGRQGKTLAGEGEATEAL